MIHTLFIIVENNYLRSERAIAPIKIRANEPRLLWSSYNYYLFTNAPLKGSSTLVKYLELYVPLCWKDSLWCCTGPVNFFRVKYV